MAATRNGKYRQPSPILADHRTLPHANHHCTLPPRPPPFPPGHAHCRTHRRCCLSSASASGSLHTISSTSRVSSTSSSSPSWPKPTGAAPAVIITRCCSAWLCSFVSWARNSGTPIAVRSASICSDPASSIESENHRESMPLMGMAVQTDRIKRSAGGYSRFYSRWPDQLRRTWVMVGRLRGLL